MFDALWQSVYASEIRAAFIKYNLTDDWSYYYITAIHTRFDDRIYILSLKYESEERREFFYERFVIINGEAFSKDDFIKLDQHDLRKKACDHNIRFKTQDIIDNLGRFKDWRFADELD